MGQFDYDPEKLKQEAADVENSKMWLNVANSAANNLLSAPSAAEIQLGQKRGPMNVGLDKVAAGMSDPWEKQKKTYEAYKAAKEGQALEADTDSNSRKANSMRVLLVSKYGASPDLVKDLSVNEMISTFGNPAKLAEMEEARKNKEADRAWQEGENEKNRQAMRENRAEDRRSKAEAKREKEDELSAVQAKQMGLYNIGSQAEEQYKKAVGDGKEYDPTSSGQWIDNSSWAPNMFKNNKAIEAQAAQDAWIESFLRDASGAAIPPSERGAYAKDFFPQPGDTNAVVQNKLRMRQQKMDNALIGAGKAGHEILAAKKVSPSDTVRVRDPKGNIKSVPRDRVSAALAAGGSLVDQIAGQ